MIIKFLKPNYYSQVSERPGVQMGPDGNLEAVGSSIREAGMGIPRIHGITALLMSGGIIYHHFCFPERVGG